MKLVFGIDPGSTQSAFIGWNGHTISSKQYLDNAHLLELIKTAPLAGRIVGVERVRSYNMRVGNETFDTCEWSIRFECALKAIGAVPILVPRKSVVIHLCGHVKAGGDEPIQAALKEKYGFAVKGLTSHLYAALGVADYVLSL